MNHDGLSPALVIHSQLSAPNMVWTTHWSGFHQPFDKAITAPAESKQTCHTAEKLFYVPKHGVPFCKKGSGQRAQKQEGTRNACGWDGGHLQPRPSETASLPSCAPGSLLDCSHLQLGASQHDIAHNTVPPSGRTEVSIAATPNCCYACRVTPRFTARCCGNRRSAAAERGQLLTWAFAFSISPCSLWITRLISEISFFVLRRSSPCFPAVTCSASYCETKQCKEKDGVRLAVN